MESVASGQLAIHHGTAALADALSKNHDPVFSTLP